MASLLSFSVPNSKMIRASSTAASSLALPVPETLSDKFDRKGIKFSESDSVPIVKLTVRNGSSLKLQIPNAQCPCYFIQARGVLERRRLSGCSLHHWNATDSTKAKGGIGLVLNDASEAGSKGSLLSTSEWTVKDVDSDAIDALQVELSSTSGTLDITYVVTLYPVSMATAVIVKNKGLKPLTMTNAILSHFKFKRRSRAAIQGLKGCCYTAHPPPSSPFEILSPGEAMKADTPGWFSFGSEPQEKLGSWTHQAMPYTILKNKLSRVYAAPPQERLKPVYNTPPSKYETLDQGRDLFYRVIRMGFEDIYLSSPGSFYEKYGSIEYFICTGPASMLVHVVINPAQQWRGAQVIEHDNL